MASPTKDFGTATPICRCRVLYLGSAVPQVTKDGLQGIQEPLKDLYPEQGASGVKGIDSWLSVWSNGMLLENVDENGKKLRRFFPIDSLHYCAAVRYVIVPGSKGEKVPRFLPLDSPFARTPSPSHPPVFAAILRRISGIKVLECHAFICKRETPANALVRCCFHAYADNIFAKQIEGGSVYGTIASGRTPQGNPPPNSIEKVQEWKEGHDLQQAEIVITNGNGVSPSQESGVDEISIYNGDENHKVWAGTNSPEKDGIYTEYGSTIRSYKSVTTPGTYHSRPRQMIMSSEPPPPPPSDKEKEKKKKKEKKKMKEREAIYRNDIREPIYRNDTLQRPTSAMNGSTLSRPMTNGTTLGRPGSAMNGYMPHPRAMMNGHGPPPPQYVIVPHKGPSSRKLHIATERRMRMHNGPARHPLPPLMMPVVPPPPPSHPMMPPLMMIPPPPPRRPSSRAVEEPIYMPSARPMSPVASYQPAHFPYEDYYMQQQYATTGRPQKYKKLRELKAKSKDRQNSPDDGTDSIYNTGIYKKKGHLNERAFSYSIRQEHRSRSHGSLANLGFGEDQNLSREEAKKEREIMQMVGELSVRERR